MTGQPRLRIDEIAFTSKDRETSAGLDLSAPFSFIYGASNTGKSFAVKAIDFMLGGNRELPDINERKPFQRIAMAMRVDDREFNLERAVVGGDFSMRGEGVEWIGRASCRERGRPAVEIQVVGGTLKKRSS